MYLKLIITCFNLSTFYNLLNHVCFFNRESLRRSNEDEDDLCEVGMGSEDTQQQQESPVLEEGNTLLYELDMQYRVLIEKYEALLEARKRDMEAEDAMAISMQTCSDGGNSKKGDLELTDGSTEAANPASRDAACLSLIHI